jgi:SAM-dependent methyltransferase
MEAVGGRQMGSVSKIRAALKIENEYEERFDAFLEILVRGGYLRRFEDRLVWSEDSWVARRRAAWETTCLMTIDNISDDPSIARFVWTTVDLMQQTVGKIPAVLRGEMSGVAALFPNNDFSKVKRVYATHYHKHFYRCIAQQVDRYVTARLAAGVDRKIRILEVGAGTGAGSIDTLTVLHHRRDAVEYVFTDLGGGLLRKAKRELRDRFDWLDYRRLDISKPPAEQGYECGDFDIVFCSNVIHATPVLADSMVHLHHLLRPGGIVLVNELCEKLPWNTITFGLTEGWWLPRDNERIPYSPIATVEVLKNHLTALGFEHLEEFGYPGSPRLQPFQILIKGRKPQIPNG